MILSPTEATGTFLYVYRIHHITYSQQFTTNSCKKRRALLKWSCIVTAVIGNMRIYLTYVSHGLLKAHSLSSLNLEL